MYQDGHRNGTTRLCHSTVRFSPILMAHEIRRICNERANNFFTRALADRGRTRLVTGLSCSAVSDYGKFEANLCGPLLAADCSAAWS